MTKIGLEKDKSCDGKEQYESKAKASYSAAQLCMKGNTRIEMVAYRCVFCLRYHVGHASMVKTIKNPTKLKREVFRIETRTYSGGHPGLKTGWCMIKQNYFS